MFCKMTRFRLATSIIFCLRLVFCLIWASSIFQVQGYKITLSRPIASRHWQGLNQLEITRIVDEHNKYRRMAKASNMRKLLWDTQLATTAQAHANKCRFEHSKLSEIIGENIWAAQFIRKSLSEAVHDWYNEVHNHSCPCGDTFVECCGHYSQVMWAETNRIGCGYALCPRILNAISRHYLVVCHYAPAGNLVNVISNGQYIGLPIFVKSDNEPCTNCPDDTVCEDGLCV